VVAELYHIINVPTLIWIDESGRICRPSDSQFGTDTFTAFHGKHSEPYLKLIRAWVHDGKGILDTEVIRKHQTLPTEETQLARAERTLAWHLHKKGRTDTAERHFLRAGELAPRDWTIRRGSMPIRGIDPMGDEFFKLYEEGAPRYPMEELVED
jgi:hypothetical protein